MNGKLVRIGQMGLCGLAVAVLTAMAAAPASADNVRVGVSPNGLSIIVADRDRDHRHGHGRGGRYDNHRDSDRYGHNRTGWKGQNNWRRDHRFWYFNGWEPVGRGYRGDRCVPVQKKSRWRGKPALLGAKACTNRYGRPFIAKRSVHLVHFLRRHGHYHGDRYCNVRH